VCAAHDAVEVSARFLPLIATIQASYDFAALLNEQRGPSAEGLSF
jgi:hypothetical protein